jgi:FkbM family methyltransferase
VSKTKRLVITFLRAVLSLVPDALLGLFNVVVPKFYTIFPENREFLNKNYLGEFTVAINTRYQIEREMLARIYEEKTHCVINSFVKPGDTCFDVGANVGAVSLMLAQRVGAGGSVVCFEPGPVICGRFEKNKKLNPSVHGIIQIHNSGLSNKKGVLYWNEHENALGNADLVEIPTEKSVSVPVTTLDDFAGNAALARLDFIKIDVESMEYEVIQGGLGTIGKYRPYIYYETLRVFEEYRKMPVFKLIQEMLSTLGYSFYAVDDACALKPAPYPEYGDYTLAIPQEKPSRLLV